MNLAAVIARVLVLATPLAAAAQEQPTMRLRLEVDHSRLSGGNADWNEVRVQASSHRGNREVAEIALVHTRRFGIADDQVQAGYATPITPKLTGSVELGFSPTHRVLPRSSAGGRIQYEFLPAWLVHAGLRHTRYDAGTVDQATLMLERYAGAFSASAAWTPARALGTGVDSVELRGTYYYGDHNSVGLIASSGQEAAQLGAGAVAVAAVHSIALVGRHRFLRSWGLTYALHRTRQGNFYTRTGAGVGAQYDF